MSLMKSESLDDPALWQAHNLLQRSNHWITEGSCTTPQNLLSKVVALTTIGFILVENRTGRLVPATLLETTISDPAVRTKAAIAQSATAVAVVIAVTVTVISPLPPLAVVVLFPAIELTVVLLPTLIVLRDLITSTDSWHGAPHVMR